MIQIKKTILTLVALLAVTTGAWADETLLLTIVSKDYTTFTSGSKTFDDKVTVTFSNFVYYGDEEGWYSDWDPSQLTVTGTNGYTITSCKFYTQSGSAETGYTVVGESPSVYLSGAYVYTDASQSGVIGYPGIKKIEVYGTAPSASSGPEVAWDGETKTGTFKMPGGNVTLEPDYYPQAALTAAPTAINDVPATTDGAIVSAGTVKNIGETETAQGTVMYYVSPTALDDAALLALAADQWTADVPTAKSLAAGQAYVYYYVRGNDSDNDAENFSDGDILAANALTVTIAAAPTYAVTFAEGVNPEPPAEPEWTASPAAGVKKGQTVTVTYTGSKKVIGVKAEKKAAAPAAEGHALSASAVGEIVGSDGKAYAAADKDNLPKGVKAEALVCYVDGEHGLALAMADVKDEKMSWDNNRGANDGKTAAEWCTGWNTSHPITGATWLLASKTQWSSMIGAAGSASNLSNAFSAVGGTNLQAWSYWSSTPNVGASAWRYYFPSSSWSWTYLNQDNTGSYIRACLAF